MLPGPLGVEYCVKVNFPQGLLPPSQVVEMQIKQVEPMAEQMLGTMPHTDVTIDGEDVAIFQQPTPVGRMAYAGIRLNGAPFGVGIVPPSDGEWSPLLKFPTWKQGAGEISEFSCSKSASTSAAELLADPQASRTLAIFDEMVASLNTAHPLSMAFTSFPHRPSLLFKHAAASELSAAGSSVVGDSQSWLVLAVAGVAGVVGASVVLIASKMVSRFSKREVLLSNMA